VTERPDPTPPEPGEGGRPPSKLTPRAQQQAGAREPEPEPPHDPTGLNLARTVARSVGARRRRRTPMKRSTDPQVSGARPDDRDPKLLSAAVDDLVRAKGWTTDINVHTLLARWPLLVGPVNAAHSRPEAYADAVLTVRTDSTAWATQLRMMAPQLVALLNDHLGDGTITRVAILGPDAPSWKKGRRAVRDGRGPRDTYG
jgi:predicted nucleic acid-binding Zn ribbon protein